MKSIYFHFIGCLTLLVLVSWHEVYGATPHLKISDNGRFLEYADGQRAGKGFFYLGDTAWELFHRLNRDEAVMYLENRARKGFTVIQAVALAELDGLNTPNAYGHRPLVDNDPRRPDVKDGPQNDYWDHVDYIVEKAASLNLFIGMLPTWGDKWRQMVVKVPWCLMKLMRVPMASGWGHVTVINRSSGFWAGIEIFTLTPKNASWNPWLLDSGKAMKEIT